MGEPCFFCGEPATLLCDAVLGLPIGGEGVHNGKPYPAVTMEAMLATPYTCDAPMCRACGNMVGHVCGNEHDTIDHCPLHHDAGGSSALMTGDEIARTRRALHFRLRTRRITEDATLREQVAHWKERALAAEEAAGMPSPERDGRAG